MAYRQHFIKNLGIHGYSIQRDGCHLSYAKSVEEAKALIDMLLD